MTTANCADKLTISYLGASIYTADYLFHNILVIVTSQFSGTLYDEHRFHQDRQRLLI